MLRAEVIFDRIFHLVLLDHYFDVLYSEEFQTKKLLVCLKCLLFSRPFSKRNMLIPRFSENLAELEFADQNFIFNEFYNNKDWERRNISLY